MTSEWSRDGIVAEVTGLVQDMTQDFDFEFERSIGQDTKLVADLDFESTDIIELLGAVESRFKRRKLPFDRLIVRDGRYSDFSIGELADFLVVQLRAPAPGPAGAASP